MAVWSIAAWLTGASAIIASERMSEADGQRFMWGGKKISAPKITIDHPEVIAVVSESTHVNLSPEAIEKKPGPKFLAKTTINIVTKSVLDEAEIDRIAAEVRKQTSYFHVVGVRFKQAQTTGSHYGWLLYWDGKEPTRFVLASKDKLSVASSGAASSLLADEHLIGTWADANAFPGTISITSRGSRLWMVESFTDGSGGDSRTRLRVRSNGRLVGMYSESQIGTFLKDGTDSDKVSLQIVGDKLQMFAGNDDDSAWFEGTPLTTIDLEAFPKSEPGKPSGGYSARGLKTISEASDCVRASEAQFPSTHDSGLTHRKSAERRVAALATAYRKCFSKSDIEKLGNLAQWGAEGQTSCGESREKPFRITEPAKAVIWAALIADEDRHIKGRLNLDRPSLVRGSDAAAPFCAKLLERFGPNGTETPGLLEP